MTDNDHSLAGIAKTHYKLAINSIQLQEYESAMYETRSDSSNKMLIPLIVATLTKHRRSTAALLSTTPISLDCISNEAGFRL